MDKNNIKPVSIHNNFKPVSYAITGLDCSGKTRLSEQLAKYLDMNHIEDDKYRYIPNSNWTKLPKDTFITNVKKAIDENFVNNKSSIVDCSYNDVYDPECAMKCLMKDILLNYKPTLIILTSESLREALKPLLHRIIARSVGILPQNICYETLDSSAGLVEKFTKYFDVNNDALKELENFACNNGIEIIIGSYQDVYNKLFL